MEERPLTTHSLTKISTFSPIGNPVDRRSKVCSNNTGNILLVSGNLFEKPRISDNKGASFYQAKGILENILGYSGCCMSSTGEYMYLTRGVESKVYVSTDKSNFVGISVGTTPITRPNTLSCSKDGKYVLVAQGGKLYSSSDFGQSWSLSRDVSPLEISSTCVSKDGEIWAIAILDSSTPSNSRVERVDSYGIGTWTLTLSGYPYYSICCSAEGDKIFAVYAGASLYMGWWTIWNSIPSVPLYGPPDNLLVSTVGCSDSGQYVVADSSDGLYVNNGYVPTNGSVILTAYSGQNCGCVSGYGRLIYSFTTFPGSGAEFYRSDLGTDFGLNIIPFSVGNSLYFAPLPQTGPMTTRTNIEKPTFTYYL